MNLENYFDSADINAFDDLPDHYDKESLAVLIVLSNYGLDAEGREVFENLPDSINRSSLLERLANHDDNSGFDEYLDKLDANQALEAPHQHHDYYGELNSFIQTSYLPEGLDYSLDDTFDGEQADSQLDEPIDYAELSNYPTEFPDYPDTADSDDFYYPDYSHFD